MPFFSGGSAHEWFKKWSVSEPRLPRREMARRGEEPERGWEGPCMKASCLFREHTLLRSHHTSNMEHIFHSWEEKGGITQVQSFFFLFHETEQTGAGVCKVWKICSCFRAQRWPRELENNIYRASHLTSFITKSHTPASPMKLGVNPSSPSLFSFSSSPPDPGLYLPSSHLHSTKDVRENFGRIQEKIVGTVCLSKSSCADDKRWGEDLRLWEKDKRWNIFLCSGQKWTSLQVKNASSISWLSSIFMSWVLK